MVNELNLGSKVSQVPDGFSNPFIKGTVTSVSSNASGERTYNVLWDGFEWETLNWSSKELILLNE